MRTLVALSTLAWLAAACEGTQVSENEARTRNQPPGTCAASDLAACEPLEVVACAADEEAVIDYSSDCCAHFSCQKLCASTVACEETPAPTCPAGTMLWIGTATDCCPAYRCTPAEECQDGINVACPLAMPYCGDGLAPIEVGLTADCCPIYQCPCVEQPVPAEGGGTASRDELVADPYCGCTYPVCGPGEQLVCQGDNICGSPCECQPVSGTCLVDEECGPDMHCDTSYCLAPPDCADGEACTAVCYGMCVPAGSTDGCRADSECPAGQACMVECAGWGCVADAGAACTCPADDYSCSCDSAGNCGGSSCRGYCMPAEPTCETVATCPMPAMPCADPVEVGVDPATCCPAYQCPRCSGDVLCAVPACEGAMIVDWNDGSCCPTYCCPGDDTCPEVVPVTVEAAR